MRVLLIRLFIQPVNQPFPATKPGCQTPCSARCFKRLITRSEKACVAKCPRAGDSRSQRPAWWKSVWFKPVWRNLWRGFCWRLSFHLLPYDLLHWDSDTLYPLHGNVYFLPLKQCNFSSMFLSVIEKVGTYCPKLCTVLVLYWVSVILPNLHTWLRK